MQVIQLETLQLIPLTPKNPEHVKTVNAFGIDGITYKALSFSLKDILRKIPTMKINNHFLVYNQGLIIGYVNLYPMETGKQTTFGMHYAVLKQYRNQGYDQEILKQVSSYLLQKGISAINLHIAPQNTASIQCALRAGFTQDGTHFYRNTESKVK